ELKLPVREHPARDVVGPPPLARILVRELVAEYPLVRRRPHRESADLLDELGVVQRPGPILVAGEEPVERVIHVGDEAVERGRRVVWRGAHAAAEVATAKPARA